MNVTDRAERWASWIVALVVAVLLASVLVSCGALGEMVGLESTATANARQAEIAKYTNEKVEAEAKRSNAVLLAHARAMDAIVGGNQAERFTREAIASEKPDTVREPEPREESPIDWEKTAAAAGTGLLAAVGIYLKTKADAKNEVNLERDARRIMRGEARTPEEARRLGWIDENGNPIPQKADPT